MGLLFSAISEVWQKLVMKKKQDFTVVQKQE